MSQYISSQPNTFSSQVGLNEIIKNLDTIKQQQLQQEKNLAQLSEQAESMRQGTQQQHKKFESQGAQQKSVDRLNRGIQPEALKTFQKMDVQSYERSNGNNSLSKSNERIQPMQSKPQQQLTPIYQMQQVGELPARKIKHKKRNSQVKSQMKSQGQSMVNDGPSRNRGTPHSFFQSRIMDYSTTLQKSLNKPTRSGKLSPLLKKRHSPTKRQFQTLPIGDHQREPILMEEFTPHNVSGSLNHGKSIESPKNDYGDNNLGSLGPPERVPERMNTEEIKKHDTQPLVSTREFETLEPSQNVVIQTVEKIIEVPVESTKIVTVEKVVEVPVEVIKYVDRVIEPNKEQQMNERKFTYQLQQSLKQYLKQAQEDKIIIQTQQSEIKRLNKEMVEKAQKRESGSGERAGDQPKEEEAKEVLSLKGQAQFESDPEKKSVREVVKEVVKEVIVEKQVEVIKEVIVEKPVQIEVIVEKPIHIEVPKEVIKEVIKEVPVEIEIIKEVEKIVYKDAYPLQDGTKEKELEQSINELQQTINSLEVKNKELQSSKSDQEKTLSYQEQQIQSLKAHLQETQQQFDDDKAMLQQNLINDQKLSASQIESLKASNEQMKDEHQSTIDDMKRKNWWMSALQLRVKKALMDQVERERSQAKSKELEMQSHKSKNSEILEKLQENDNGSQLLSEENQKLQERIKALEQQLSESEDQRQLAIQTQNDQKLALEKIKADHLVDLQEKDQKIKSMESDFNKTVNQYEKINAENMRDLKQKANEVDTKDETIRELQKQLQAMSQDLKIVNDEKYQLEFKNQALAQSIQSEPINSQGGDQNSQTESLRKNLNESLREIKDLKSQLDERSKTNQESQQSIDKLKDTNADLQKSSSEKDKEIQDLKDQLTQKPDAKAPDNLTSSTEKPSAEAQNNTKELEDKLNSLQAKFDKSQEKVKQLQKDLENTQKLKTEAKKIEQQIQKVNQKVSLEQKQKTQEIEQLKKQIEEDNQYNEDIRKKLQEESQQIENQFNHSIQKLTGQLAHVQTKNWWMAALQIKVRKIMIVKLEEAKKKQVEQRKSEDAKVLQMMEKQILQKQQVMKLEILQLKKAIEIKNQSVQTNQIEEPTTPTKALKETKPVDRDSPEGAENISPNTSFQKIQSPIETTPKIEEKPKESVEKKQKKEEVKPKVEAKKIEEKPESIKEPVKEVPKTVEQVTEPQPGDNSKQIEEKKQLPVKTEPIQPYKEPEELPQDTKERYPQNFEVSQDPLPPSLQNDSTPIKADQDFGTNDLDNSILSLNNEFEDLLDNMKQSPNQLPAPESHPSDLKMEDLIQEVQNTSNIASEQDFSLSFDQEKTPKESPETENIPKPETENIPKPEASETQNIPKPETEEMPKPQQSKKAKKNRFSFKQYMRNSKTFTVKLQKQFDEIWDQFDTDGNAYLDKDESRKFILEVKKIIPQERADNYQEEQFPEFFQQFDDDKNGVLSKGEMAQFIKVVFKGNDGASTVIDDQSNMSQMNEDFAEDLMPKLQSSQILESGENDLPFNLDGPARELSKTMPNILDTKKRESLKKSGEMSLHQYLKKYPVKFEKDLDELWSNKDTDKNGYLDEAEAKDFVSDVAKVIDKDRAKNYEKENFPQLFKKFDEDNNGFLSKGEMAQFIKVVFKSQKGKSSINDDQSNISQMKEELGKDLMPDLQTSQILESPDNQLSFDLDGPTRELSKTMPNILDSKKRDTLKKIGEMSLHQYLKKYPVKFEKDLDELWSNKDTDKNGYLDEAEAKDFVIEVSKIIEQERAKNLDIERFPELFKKFDEDNNGFLNKGEMAQFIKVAFKKDKQKSQDPKPEPAKQDDMLDMSKVEERDDLSDTEQSVQPEPKAQPEQQEIQPPFDLSGDQRPHSKTLQPDRKKEKLKNNKLTFKQYMRTSKIKFEKDLDILWVEKDEDGNGFLNMNEAKEFMVEIQKIIESERAKNFDLQELPILFQKYDEDNNGYLTKGQMAQLIKLVFNKQKDTTKEEDKQNTTALNLSTDSLPFDINGPQRDLSKTMQPITSESDKLLKAQKPFENYLKKYKVTFNGNLDEIWNKKDADQNGYLCKDEAREFLLEVQKIIQEDRAKNLNIDEFPEQFDKFDEDMNGYLTKQEMSLFIKRAFKERS